MIDILVVVLLGLLLASPSESLSCRGAPNTTCEDYPPLGRQDDPGAVCEGSLDADCKVLGEFRDGTVEAFSQWVDAGLCTEDGIADAAAAIAESAAAVWSNALLQVSCLGQGTLCGFSTMGAKDWAARMQEELVASAVAGGVDAAANGKICYGDLRTVVGDLEEAVNSRAGEVCLTGGSADDFEQGYAQDVLQGVQQALGKAVAKECNFEQSVQDSSMCSKTQGSNRAKSGDKCAGASDKKPCSGSGEEKCCKASFKLSICLCSGCNGPWRRVSKPGESTREFKDLSGTVCYCRTDGK